MQGARHRNSESLRTAAALAVVALALLADYAATFAYGDPRASYVAVGGIYGAFVAFASVATVLLCRGRGLVTTGLFLGLLVVFFTMMTVLATRYGDYHLPTAVVLTHGAVVVAAIASLVFYFVALARYAA